MSQQQSVGFGVPYSWLAGWRDRCWRPLGWLVSMIVVIVAMNASVYGVHAAPRIGVKALLVNMFSVESAPIIEHFGPWNKYRVAGLPDQSSTLRCRADGLCQVTTGMGYANVALSLDAVQRDARFDMRQAYVIVAGIAGVNPHYGTVGTTAWSRHLVDMGIQWNIDPRDNKGTPWPSGYTGIDAPNTHSSGPLLYKTEVATLDQALVDKAYSLTRQVHLHDNARARSWRQRYGYAPANQPPQVTVCDTVSSDTWWAGKRNGQRAQQWTRILTHGRGKYCMTAQEDNATYETLRRGTVMGVANVHRLLVLRAGSDFDRAYPGGSEVENLRQYSKQGGEIAPINLVITLTPILNSITQHWNEWA